MKDTKQIIRELVEEVIEEKELEEDIYGETEVQEIKPEPVEVKTNKVLNYFKRND